MALPKAGPILASSRQSQPNLCLARRHLPQPHKAQLQEVVAEVGGQDLDDEQVEVEGFQAIQDEGAEQEVVEDGPPGPAVATSDPFRRCPH